MGTHERTQRKRHKPVRHSLSHYLLLSCLVVATGCFAHLSTAESIKITGLTLPDDILETAAQDPKVFTQGFELDDGWFYQSSGLYGKSFIVRFPLNNSFPALTMKLPRQYFAEGITLFNNELFLISWKGETGWRLDPRTLNVINSFNYEGEGWGLTHDEQHIIMSNGSHLLKFYQPENFTVAKTLAVTLDGKPLDNLNELELVDGIIWANRWKSDVIYGIDSKSGKVIISVDCAALRTTKEGAAKTNRDDVLNGIAYDAEKKAFWLTGKNWAHRYLVKLPSPHLNTKHSE